MTLPADTTRVIVVTVREDDAAWEIEIDPGGIDPWSVTGILRGAYKESLALLEGDEADDDE